MVKFGRISVRENKYKKGGKSDAQFKGSNTVPIAYKMRL